MIENFKQLTDRALEISRTRGKTITVVVAAGQDQAALSALIEARRTGLAQGILVGDPALIQQTLTQLAPEMVDQFQIEPAKDDYEIAAKAVKLVLEGQAEILMKGKIKTGTLFKAILDKNCGLRTGKLMSDVFVFEFPERSGNQLLMITDGGITLAPDLDQKIQLIENAVNVAHALGNSKPKVAILSAVETVNPELPSTVDAAILAKMNQRGQITGCVIDGPLALDNAISPRAAQEKGIDSQVAGHAEILLCPNIESANMLAKGTTYFAALPLAHTCVGAKAPILIPSRADTAAAKLFSIALSVVVAEYNLTAKSV